jgi:hypothetical protein
MGEWAKDQTEPQGGNGVKQNINASLKTRQVQIKKGQEGLE